MSSKLNIPGHNHTEIIAKNRFSDYLKDKEIDLKNMFKKQIENSFLTYQSMQDYMQYISITYPAIVHKVSLGNSFEGRMIEGVIIGDKNPKIPTIVIDSLIHPRERVAGATAMYIMRELVENPENKKYIEGVTWIIIPCLNPDGYIYTAKDHMWRKNRRPHEDYNCIGTDLNRNFGFHWEAPQDQSSKMPCESTYQGSKGFSEPESQLYGSFLKHVKANNKFILYVSFHSFGGMILYPYSYAKKLPPNEKEYKILVQKYLFASQLSKHGSRHPFSYGESGSSALTLYPTPGSSDDWVYGVLKVPLSFTIELPGINFISNEKYIQPIADEAFLGLIAMADYVVAEYGK